MPCAVYNAILLEWTAAVLVIVGLAIEPRSGRRVVKAIPKTPVGALGADPVVYFRETMDQKLLEVKSVGEMLAAYGRALTTAEVVKVLGVSGRLVSNQESGNSRVAAIFQDRYGYPGTAFFRARPDPSERLGGLEAHD